MRTLSFDTYDLTFISLASRVELGRILYKMGQKERAWRELEMAVLLDEPDINAHLEKVYQIHSSPL